MRCADFASLAAVVLMLGAPMACRADAPVSSAAARLSAVAGGMLDSDLGEGGALAQPIDYDSVRLMPGRALEYRRRIALEMRLAAASARPPFGPSTTSRK